MEFMLKNKIKYSMCFVYDFTIPRTVRITTNIITCTYSTNMHNCSTFIGEKLIISLEKYYWLVN